MFIGALQECYEKKQPQYLLPAVDEA